jgi:hypothetical protein
MYIEIHRLIAYAATTAIALPVDDIQSGSDSVAVSLDDRLLMGIGDGE